MAHSLHLTLDGDNELTEICGWCAWGPVSDSWNDPIGTPPSPRAVAASSTF